MSGQIVLLLGLCLIAWLIRTDMKWRSAGSWFLLVPAIFVSIQGSRPLSFWFGSAGTSSNLEGNPVNTAYFAALIVVSLMILQRRGVPWAAISQCNKALLLMYLCFAGGALFSDMPLLSLKRLVKDFACVLVAMVILSEVNPVGAFRSVFVRVACVLFSLSLILGKYFPDLGRSYTYAGEPMFNGVAPQKNLLGEVVFVFGLVVSWDLLQILKTKRWREQKGQLFLRLGLLLLGLWLLITCDSKTSLVCLSIGVLVLLGSERLVRMRYGKRLLILCLAGSFLMMVSDKWLGISSSMIKALGRDPTLTGRTDIWTVALKQQTNPLLGCGFELFWDTEKGEAVGGELAYLRSAHNGYVETYLNGGLLGVIVLGVFLLATGRRVINRLFAGDAMGGIGLAFWITALIFNFSESSFLRLDPLWFTLLLVTIHVPAKFLPRGGTVKGTPQILRTYHGLQRPVKQGAAGAPSLFRVEKLDKPVLHGRILSGGRRESGSGG